MKSGTKKFIALVLAMGVVISVTACGGDTDASKNKDSVEVSADTKADDCDLSITVFKSSPSDKDEDYQLFHEGITFTSVTQDEKYTYVHYTFDNKLGYPIEFYIPSVKIDNKSELSANDDGGRFLYAVESNGCGFYAEAGESVEGIFAFVSIKPGDDVHIYGDWKKPDGSMLKPCIHFTFEEGDGSVSVDSLEPQ